MGMNSTELNDAAAKIEAGANKRRAWAEHTSDPLYVDLYRGVAQQLQDRAEQVRSWAANSAHLEGCGEVRDPERQTEIEAATREFLAMAGEKDNG